MSIKRRLAADGNRRRRQAGLTMIELLVALSLVVIVVITAGFIYLTNQQSFRRGREKLLAQQNLSWCVEAVSRDLRRAWRADRVNAQKIVLYDVDGFVFATWELGSEGGQDRLLRNGTAQAPEQCTVLVFTVEAPDTSAIGVDLELADPSDNRVRMGDMVQLRNFEMAGPS
jgi:prepilin-type N-terminal cleavage/methylation domain-containing protein